MASRRDILKTGLAASAAPLAGISAAAAAGKAAAASSGPVHKAVYDERFPASRAFGRAATLRGWPLAPIRGDVTDLWFHDLALKWKAGPATICGMTGKDSLFCLEHLAWDASLRVLWRAEDSGTGLVSWVIGPRAAPRAGAKARA